MLSPLKELLGFVFPFFTHIPVIRAMLGFILIFFLPGFAWTLVFFRKIHVLERMVFSFGLSIAVVTLSLLLGNRLIRMELTAFNSVLVIIFITIVPVLIFYLNRFIRGGRGRPT